MVSNDVSNFVEVFHSLLPNERLSVLEAVLSNLSNTEANTIYRKLLSHPGRFRDLLGSLPSEIVDMVVEYLDPLDIVRLEHVSRRWMDIFRSDRVCFNSLKRLEGSLQYQYKYGHSELDDIP